VVTDEISAEDVHSGEAFALLLAAYERMRRVVWEDPRTNSDLLRAEGMRYVMNYISAGHLLCCELSDPYRPTFARWADITNTWGNDNPDCVYLFAAIDGIGTYEISGECGSARYLDVQVHAPHFAEAPEYRVIASKGRQELVTHGEREIKVILSPNRHPENWIRTAPGVGSVCVRQYFYNWEDERPARLSIERIDGARPLASRSTAEMARNVARLVRWLDRAEDFWDQLCKRSLETPPNSIPFGRAEETESGGLKGLSYGMGNFRCQPDEAVVLEVEPPPCLYWSFSLGNWYWGTIDWVYRQSSLNGHQAHLDADGMFRAVIAHSDPGVWNWLDPAGHTWGTINGRWLFPTSVVEPTLRVVPLDAVPEVLPSSTRWVRPAERELLLRQRARAAQLRNCQ